MKNAFIITIATIIFSTTVNAQAWRQNGKFTPGAEKALYDLWGRHMGYTPAETVAKADSIYKHGNYRTIKVLNTGVNASGKIKTLEIISADCVYLGRIPADEFGWSDATVEFNLRRDCGNGGVCNKKNVIPTVTIQDSVEVQVQVQIVQATKQHLDYAFMSTETGTQTKVYSEQDMNGANTGNTTVIKVQGEPQPLYYYQEKTRVRVYDTHCGCYVLRVKTLEPVKVRDTHIITFAY